ncbi:MAG TPA: L-fucose mutarotase [Cellvibrio sp.]|nr:L-fucose mutarotase [Cellvibrio sp.]
MAVDMQNDPVLIDEYKHYHAPGQAWPEITESIKRAGIIDMQIYAIGNRLFMIMDVDESFSFDAKASADAANPKVAEWEALMWKYQSPLPWAKPGEKWVLMEEIYRLP